MPVFDNSKVEKVNFPGIIHQTVAGVTQGAKNMEVWMQTAEPNTETPMHYHDCEEIVIVLKGSGNATVDGKTTAFGPDTTIIIPPEVDHQIANTGSEPMSIIAVLSKVSPTTYYLDGRVMSLPWATS